nr:hypothetical protein [Tanacetum cinerariifolium]
MFIGHMHHPWRTLASIINKCLLGKTNSNDRLCQSRVAIIWGMFHKKYVDFFELSWEDFSYQIDNMQLKKGRREIMLYPRFTKVIINHFLSIYKSVPKGLPSGLHTIKDDDVLSRMKFVRIREDVQEYGQVILDVMLSNAIKQSNTKKAFFSYSTGQVLPKKTREESRDHSHKLKGVDVMTKEEDLAANTMQVLKAIKKSSRSQPHTGGSSKGTGVSPRVLDESTVIVTTSSEGTGIKPGVPDEEKCAFKAKADSTLDWDSEEESDYLRKKLSQPVNFRSVF